MAFLKNPPIKRTFLCTLFCLGFLFNASASFSAQGNEPLRLQEQKIKAGLLYNFIKYSTWPNVENSKIPFQICLLGGDSFDGALQPLQGRTAQQRKINIKRVAIQSSDLSQCHILSLHKSEEKNISSIFKTIKDLPILTMSDINGFTRYGGMVEFSKSKDSHIRLILNKKRIQKSGLNIGKQLLKLAEAG